MEKSEKQKEKKKSKKYLSIEKAIENNINELGKNKKKFKILM